eukprot:COSAG05_NODE_12948_length_447_cov_3.853448_1_plen_54_part_01
MGSAEALGFTTVSQADCAGLGEETISGQEALDTDISTAAKLYAEVCRRHVYDVA